jgi:hypothetical protein
MRGSFFQLTFGTQAKKSRHFVWGRSAGPVALQCWRCGQIAGRCDLTTLRQLQRAIITFGTVGTDPPLYPGPRRVRNRVVPAPRRGFLFVYHFPDAVLASFK